MSLNLLTVHVNGICLCFTLQQARHKLSKVRNVTGLYCKPIFMKIVAKCSAFVGLSYQVHVLVTVCNSNPLRVWL